MLMQALTEPRTTQYGCSYLVVSHRESLLRSSPASPGQTISGDDKRGEVLALFETGLQVLLLLLTLLRGQDLVGVSGPIQLGVRICHTDVNNDIRPTGPEASNEEISPLFVA